MPTRKEYRELLKESMKALYKYPEHAGLRIRIKRVIDYKAPNQKVNKAYINEND